MKCKENFKKLEKKYSTLLLEVDRQIIRLLDQVDCQKLSRFNAGFKAYEKNKFRMFVERERRRYLKALDIITGSLTQGEICDLGGFIPYLPVALSLLGFRVKIVEKYSLYGGDFKNALRDITEKYSIKLFDMDILIDSFKDLGINDAVLLLAVVEHLNGSPRELLKKIKTVLRPGGILVLEVPNLAEINKRFALFSGKSPLGDYHDYFYSDYPYLGHNREMTVAEVKLLMEKSGFHIEDLDCYDYFREKESGFKRKFSRMVKNILPLRYKEQSIMVKGTPKT